MPELRLPASASDLVSRFGGVLSGPEAAGKQVEGFATLADAQPADVAFYENPRYLDDLRATGAGVVVLNPDDAALRTGVCIEVEEKPRSYFSRMLNACAAGREFSPGIGAGAVVDDTASLGEDVHVGAGAVIGAGVQIGARTAVLARAVVTEGCRIGADCILHEGCVVGSEGFGFYPDTDGLKRVNHLGGVVVEDRVEVGANSCIDRGVLGDTVIASGVKIDNLVQIGHNVRIGADCVICGSVAIGGSAAIGARCMIGGGSKIANHATVADDVKLQGMTGVASSIRKPGGVYGSVIPHTKIEELHRIWVALRRIGQGRGKDE